MTDISRQINSQEAGVRPSSSLPFFLPSDEEKRKTHDHCTRQQGKSQKQSFSEERVVFQHEGFNPFIDGEGAKPTQFKFSIPEKSVKYRKFWSTEEAKY